MAEVKDKTVTVEALSALHEHNKTAYMPIDGVYTKEEVYTKAEVDAAIQAAIEAALNTTPSA